MNTGPIAADDVGLLERSLWLAKIGGNVVSKVSLWWDDRSTAHWVASSMFRRCLGSGTAVQQAVDCSVGGLRCYVSYDVSPKR
jgi:hypothetical protein